MILAVGSGMDDVRRESVACNMMLVRGWMSCLMVVERLVLGWCGGS